MHILTLPSQVVLGDKDIIEPGEYVVEDLNGAQLLMLAGGGGMRGLGVAQIPVDIHTRELLWAPIRGIDNAHILIMRAGGFGDLTLLTPVLREIKRRWPQAKLAVSTMRHYAPVLENLPYIDEVLPYPLKTEIVSRYDVRIYLENAVERNERAKELHMTDLFGEICGVDMSAAEKLQPDYVPRTSELLWASQTYPRTPGVRRVSIQVGASTMSRIYPTGRVAKLLIDAGWEVMLLGNCGEVQDRVNGKVPRLHNLTGAGLAFRESCAIIHNSDAFIGADSALLHVAGAMDVPAVGLYAAFPWQLRTKYSPSIRALSGDGPCAPCFHHFKQSTKQHFPEGCPSAATKRCGVLASIPAERIVSTVERIARAVPEGVS